MNPNTLTIHMDGPVALVTLNRPAVHNAMNDLLIMELTEAARQLESDPAVRAIVLTGMGTSFCSGMDLDYLRKLANYDSAQNRQDTENLKALFLSIRQSALPWVAAVNGPAIAGGCGLASLCDIIVADREEARFGYPETRIGFIPALVSWPLIQRVGETHARDLLLSGRIMKADHAKEIGLINELSESGQVVQMAGTRARTLATKCSRTSLAVTKALIGKIAGMTFEESLEIAVQENVASRVSESCKKGVSAFLNKEKIDWMTID
jgi:methylglutaconyl-CoA hydratase